MKNILGAPLNWKSLLLFIVCGCFFLCLSFLIHQSFDHAKVFTSVQSDNQDGLHEDFEIYLYVLYAMSLSGFLMMVLLGGGILNAYRMNKTLNALYNISATQMRAVETSRDGIAILNADGVFTYMNHAHALCYGYGKPDDLIGKTWKNLYDGDRLTHFETDVFPALQKNGWWSGESIGKRADGTVFPQEVSLSALEGDGLICVVRDVSEKVENEKYLKMICLAVEAADDGIAITDADNKFLFMNESFLKIHGIEGNQKQHIIGTDWRDVYNEVGQEHINTIVLPTTILKGMWSGSMPVMRKNGSIFYGDASLTRLKDGLILGVMRDVNDRHKAELEGEALREELLRAQKMEVVARLADGITSDFGRIIQSIRQQAKTLQKKAVPNTEEQGCVSEIIDCADKADILVGQLMSFNQKKNVKSRIIDIGACLADLRKELQDVVCAGHEVIIDIKEEDAHTHANPEQLTQIIRNLCMNAGESIKGRAGKVAVILKEAERAMLGLQSYLLINEQPSRAVAARSRQHQINETYYLMSGLLVRGKKYLQLSVSDNGAGIPAEALSNIFDPFFTTKKHGHIAGLGLSSVHGVILSLHGAIVVETIPDAGTTVHLFFPRTDVLEYMTREEHAVAI